MIIANDNENAATRASEDNMRAGISEVICAVYGVAQERKLCPLCLIDGFAHFIRFAILTGRVGHHCQPTGGDE